MNTCRICGKEIGKTYSDKKLRCSSCRKSVENAIGYNERTVEYVEDELYAWKSEYKKLKKENEKLNEFKNRREESMFYFKAQMERAEPKTAKEAEDLQKAKELFEKLYREELYYLEQENKELKENIKMLSGNIILG